MFSLMAVLIAVGPASAGVILLNSDDCAAEAAKLKDDNVAYQPGIDAYGNPVASADLNDTGRIDYNLNDLNIAIGNPLIATSGVVGDETAFKAAGGLIDTYGANSSVGSVTLRDGEVLFNGQRITDNKAQMTTVDCLNK